MTTTTVEDAHQFGTHFMNRWSQKYDKLGKNAPEDMRFCVFNFYRVTAIAVLDP